MHIGEVIIKVIGPPKEREFTARTGPKAGQTVKIRFQEAEVTLPGARHPRDIEVRPPDGNMYALGNYRIAASSVKVNNFGSLEMKYIDLVAVMAQVAQKTA